MVTVVFANNFLDARIAENEFSSSRQFMLTTGLQVDDVAWTIGRTQTVRYSSRYGNLQFEPSVLNYTFDIYTIYDDSWRTVLNTTTGIILYNMPTSEVTYGNNYFERIFPSNDSFLLSGSSAPVTHVFAVEKLPMPDGSYTRVVAAPSLRMLSSTVGVTSYFKFYLPSLDEGTNKYLSQSITLQGKDVDKVKVEGVTQVRITVAFPAESQGYDSTFFNFESSSEVVDTDPDGAVVEFYVGTVTVSIGLTT